MGRDNQLDVLGGVDSEPCQVLEDWGLVIGPHAGVDDHAIAVAEVHEHALAVPWPER